MWQDLFRQGELLLSDQPSAVAETVASGLPLIAELLFIFFVLLAIQQLKRILQLFPYLTDAVFRARGSAALENSVRVSHDRDLLAAILLLPAVLFMYRYRLYDPHFLQGLSPNLYMLSQLGVFVSLLAVREIMYLLLKPRRNYENYQVPHRMVFTYFILLMIVMLLSVGVMSLLNCSDYVIRTVIYAETALFYMLFVFRRAQILRLSCNPFRTFLYLCALEFLPTALLVVSAVVL